MRKRNVSNATGWSFLYALVLIGLMLPWTSVRGAPAFQSVQTSTATTNALAINKPTGAVHNDLLLATLSARGNTTITPPTGWQLIQRSNNGTAETLAVYYRIVNDDDASVTSYTFTLGASVG